MKYWPVYIHLTSIDGQRHWGYFRVARYTGVSTQHWATSQELLVRGRPPGGIRHKQPPRNPVQSTADSGQRTKRDDIEPQLKCVHERERPKNKT